MIQVEGREHVCECFGEGYDYLSFGTGEKEELDINIHTCDTPPIYCDFALGFILLNKELISINISCFSYHRFRFPSSESSSLSRFLFSLVVLTY